MPQDLRTVEYRQKKPLLRTVEVYSKKDGLKDVESSRKRPRKDSQGNIILPDEHATGDPNDPRWKEHNERKKAVMYGTLGGAIEGVTIHDAKKAEPKKKKKKGELEELAEAGAKAGEGWGTLRALLNRMRGGK